MIARLLPAAHLAIYPFEKYGEPVGVRTRDLLIKSQLLWHNDPERGSGPPDHRAGQILGSRRPRHRRRRRGPWRVFLPAPADGRPSSGQRCFWRGAITTSVRAVDWRQLHPWHRLGLPPAGVRGLRLSFTERAPRFNEAITLMRRLWGEPQGGSTQSTTPASERSQFAQVDPRWQAKDLIRRYRHKFGK